MHKYVFNFFLEHHVITTLQSGFTAGDSTVNQLVDIYNTFCRALDEGKKVRAVFFFDISILKPRYFDVFTIFVYQNIYQ